MSEDIFGKRREPFELKNTDEEELGQSVSRARNRTVLLTPDVTSQVRSRLQEEEPSGVRDPLSELLPPIRWDRPGTGSSAASSVAPAAQAAPTAAPASTTSATGAAPSGAGFTPERFQPVAKPTEESARRATGKLVVGEGLPPLKPMVPMADDVSASWERPKAEGTSRGDLKPWEELITEERKPAPKVEAQAVKPAPLPTPEPLVEPAPIAKPAVTPEPAPVAKAVVPEPPVSTAKSQTPPLAAAPAKSQVKQEIVMKTSGRVLGFLVGVDAGEGGELIELRTGRWLITSRPTDHGEYILLDDPTISPLHAILRVTKDGKVQVLDQLSEHGSGLLRAGATEEEELSGTMVTLAHGDVIRFGARYYVACVIPQVKLPGASA